MPLFGKKDKDKDAKAAPAPSDKNSSATSPPPQKRSPSPQQKHEVKATAGNVKLGNDARVGLIYPEGTSADYASPLARSDSNAGIYNERDAYPSGIEAQMAGTKSKPVTMQLYLTTVSGPPSLLGQIWAVDSSGLRVGHNSIHNHLIVPNAGDEVGGDAEVGEEQLKIEYRSGRYWLGNTHSRNTVRVQHPPRLGTTEFPKELQLRGTTNVFDELEISNGTQIHMGTHTSFACVLEPLVTPFKPTGMLNRHNGHYDENVYNTVTVHLNRMKAAQIIKGIVPMVPATATGGDGASGAAGGGGVNGSGGAGSTVQAGSKQITLASPTHSHEDTLPGQRTPDQQQQQQPAQTQQQGAPPPRKSDAASRHVYFAPDGLSPSQAAMMGSGDFDTVYDDEDKAGLGRQTGELARNKRLSQGSSTSTGSAGTRPTRQLNESGRDFELDDDVDPGAEQLNPAMRRLMMQPKRRESDESTTVLSPHGTMTQRLPPPPPDSDEENEGGAHSSTGARPSAALATPGPVHHDDSDDDFVVE